MTRVGARGAPASSAEVVALLGLLADEAPSPQFADAVERIRRSNDTNAGEAVRLALRIRETLSERRRREAEFAALEETVADLASLRDVGAVLEAIVRRARRLIGTDASYLTLVEGDDTNRLFTRVTDGISSRGFRDVPAIGIGNLVMSTGSPHWTSDYFADQRFRHASGADAVVAEEGLVAILAVPVTLHGRPIGILSAADRRSRTFDPREATLLTSLAAHAGVAIENARLFESATLALERLQDATEEAQRRRDEAERAAAVHERLTRIVLDGGGVIEVVAATAEGSGRHVEVRDADGRRLAHAGEVVGPAIEEARGPVWQTPVVAGTERLGELLVDGPSPNLAEIRVLERAAQVTALVLLQRRVVFEAENRTRAELVRDILAATMQETEQISERARLFGVDVDRPHLVAVARCEGTRRERVLAAGAALHGKFGGMLAEHDGDLVLVLPDGEETRESDAASMFLNGLRTRLSATVTAGVAGPVCGVAGIAGAYRDGRRCLTLLRALGRSGEVARQADLGVYGLLLSSAAPGDLDRFVRTQIGPLLDHDETNGTVLVPTLDAWFGHGLNMTRTAHALHVHVNTLYQRFERIDKLLGPRWREAEGGLHTQLALRLTALRVSTG